MVLHGPMSSPFFWEYVKNSPMRVPRGDVDRFLVRCQHVSLRGSLPVSRLTLLRLIAGGLAALVLRFLCDNELDQTIASCDCRIGARWVRLNPE